MFSKIKEKLKSFYFITLSYITVFLILLITLITILFFVNYDRFTQSIIYSYSRDSLFQVSYGADYMLESAATLSKQIFFDSTVSELLYAKSSTDFDTLMALNRLGNYVNATNNVNSVYIFNIPHKQVAYAFRNSSQYVEPLDDFFDKDVLNYFKTNENIDLQPIPRKTGKSGEYPSIGEKDVYSFALLDRSSGKSIPEGAVIINYSTDWLYNAISYLDKSPDSTTFIIDNKGVVISNNSAFRFLSDISDNGFIKDIRKSSKPYGYFIVNVNGLKSFVTFVSSSKLSWKFIRITPYSSISARLNKIRIISLLGYLFIMVLGIIASISISKRLYKPYNSMDNKVKALENKNRNSFIYYKQDFLQNLLNNSDAFSYETIIQKFNELDIKLTADKYMIILFKIDHYEDFCSSYRFNERNLLKFEIAGTISELCSEYCINEAVVTNSDHVVLIACTDNTNVAIDIAEKGREAVLKSLDISCFVVISSNAASLEYLSMLYNEMLEAAYFRMFIGHGRIICSKEASMTKNNNFIYPEQKEKQLLDSIMLGKIDDAKAYYIEIIDMLKDCSYNTFVQTITQLALEISKIINTLKKNHNISLTFNFNSFILELNKLETIEDINNVFFNVFHEINEIINWKKIKKYDELIESVIKIINEDYWDANLTLESISDKVKVSSSHLRHLFIRSANKPLSKYISEVRINKVKELLNTTSLSVGDIAEKTGFISSSYLFTVFKKITGTTPNEYRKLSERN